MSRWMLASVAVAACMAAICVLGGVVGAVVSLMAAVPGLAVIKCRGRRAESPSQMRKEYLRWLVCTCSFGLFVAFLVPFAQVMAAAFALVLLSPLFGTSIFIVATALFDPLNTECGC